MKVVLLLAGRGRRLGRLTEAQSKVLIELKGKPLLGHLMEKLLFAGLRDYIPVVGYQKEAIMAYLQQEFARRLKISPVVNPKYLETNNLYSLWCAKEFLIGEPFLVCNGDLILNKFIVKKLVEHQADSGIAIDDSPRECPIDSPGVRVEEGRILDLGRHIPFDRSSGYAIGLYKFGAEDSIRFFEEAGKMLQKGMYQAGFHDPLLKIFHETTWVPVSTDGLLWNDIDTPEDIPKAESLIRRISEEETEISGSSQI